MTLFTAKFLPYLVPDILQNLFVEEVARLPRVVCTAVALLLSPAALCVSAIEGLPAL
jgi:hypothetical protein